MFFKKLVSEPRPSIERSSSNGATGSSVLKSISGGAATEIAVAPSSQNSEAGLGLVLDALGGVLTALARYPIDLPDRPGEESAGAIERWQRHATLGYAITEGNGTRSVGVNDRDWGGVVRAVTEQRRDEHQYVESSISELREALWSCVETVHKAVKIDHTADASTDTEMDRAKNALKRMQTGSIKQEVLGAVLSIEGALQARRDQQQEQYVSLATKLDRMGKQLEEARKESTTDPLTGIGNRKLFDMMGPRAVQMFALGRQPVVLLMIDLDKLKLVNDMYGHQAGDAAIANLGGALAKVFLRQSDVLCRYGGGRRPTGSARRGGRMDCTCRQGLVQSQAEWSGPSVCGRESVAQVSLIGPVGRWVMQSEPGRLTGLAVVFVVLATRSVGDSALST